MIYSIIEESWLVMELLIVATLPVLLIGLYLYKKDKNKEPGKLLAKLFISGILSCLLVLIVSEILGSFFPLFNAETSTLNQFELLIYVFVGVALVEEGCKWYMVYKISYNHDEFDEFYDMILYSAMVSLGFALFENILYVYSGGMLTGILRAILAVPGHVCDAVFMGYYLALSKVNKLNGREDLRKKNLALSIIVPATLHGIYDYCLFSEIEILLIIFVIFVIILYVKTVQKIKKSSSLTVPIRPQSQVQTQIQYSTFQNANQYAPVPSQNSLNGEHQTPISSSIRYCTNCGTPITSNFCPKCGRPRI